MGRSHVPLPAAPVSIRNPSIMSRKDENDKAAVSGCARTRDWADLWGAIARCIYVGIKAVVPRRGITFELLFRLISDV
jgi:hypothetical protein